MKLKSATAIATLVITACTIAMVFPAIECVYNLCNGIENTWIHWSCLAYFVVSLSATGLIIKFSIVEDPEDKL